MNSSPVVIGALLIAAQLVAGAAHAQDPAHDDTNVLERYGSERLEFRTKYFIFFFDEAELRQGTNVVPPDDYQSTFGRFEPASLHHDSAVAWHTASVLARVTALALYVAAIAVAQPWDRDSGDETSGILLAVGGFAASIYAMWFENVSVSRLLDATNAYNANLLRQSAAPSN